jgi:hypothetical protein
MILSIPFETEIERWANEIIGIHNPEISGFTYFGSGMMSKHHTIHI